MSEKIAHINSIGLVKIRKTKNNKTIRISISPSRGILVTIPYWYTYQKVIPFIESKKQWIQQNRVDSLGYFSVDKLKSLQIAQKTIELNAYEGIKIQHKVYSEYIRIDYPEMLEDDHAERNSQLRLEVEKIIRKEALLYLPKRLLELSNLYNLSYRNVRIKRLKSRWGSCSHHNNINLNMFLMLLPPYLIDYVLLHELTHTQIKNHSPRFWELLHQYIPDPKKHRLALKKYPITFLSHYDSPK